MGFEPMRPKGATGSQGLRIIHSAIPAIIQANLSTRLHFKFLLLTLNMEANLSSDSTIIARAQDLLDSTFRSSMSMTLQK